MRRAQTSVMSASGCLRGTALDDTQTQRSSESAVVGGSELISRGDDRGADTSEFALKRPIRAGKVGAELRISTGSSHGAVSYSSGGTCTGSPSLRRRSKV